MAAFSRLCSVYIKIIVALTGLTIGQAISRSNKDSGPAVNIDDCMEDDDCINLFVLKSLKNQYYSKQKSFQVRVVNYGLWLSKYKVLLLVIVAICYSIAFSAIHR